MEITITNFKQISALRDYIAKYFDNNSVMLLDHKGSVADCRSILGMLSLSYDKPVRILYGKEIAESIRLLVKSITEDINYFEKDIFAN